MKTPFREGDMDQPEINQPEINQPEMDQLGRELPTGAWLSGLTRVPYWVYRDPEVARDEQARIFEGPAWHFLCLEIDVPGTVISLLSRTGVPIAAR
jgi:hypothetical protein